MPSFLCHLFSSPHRAFHRAFDITQYRRDPQTGQLSRVRGTDIVPPISRSRCTSRSPPQRSGRASPSHSDDDDDDDDDEDRESYTPHHPARRYHNAEDRALYEFYLRERAGGDHQPREADCEKRPDPADVNVEERSPGMYERPGTRRGWHTPSPESPQRRRSRSPARSLSPRRGDEREAGPGRKGGKSRFEEMQGRMYEGVEVLERRPRE